MPQESYAHTSSEGKTPHNHPISPAGQILAIDSDVNGGKISHHRSGPPALPARTPFPRKKGIICMGEI